MPTQFWRLEETREKLKHLDRPGFALEFLRRNPDYRKDRDRTQRLIAQGTLDRETAEADLARRWGLRFCPRPGCCSGKS